MTYSVAIVRRENLQILIIIVLKFICIVIDKHTLKQLSVEVIDNYYSNIMLSSPIKS